MVLFSTIGVSVNRHYCQGQLRSTGLWWMPASCHEATVVDDKLPSCPFHAQQSDTEKRNCCSDEADYQKIETAQDFVFSKILIGSPTLALQVPFFANYNQEVAILETDYNMYCFHPPPKLVARRVLYQRFLI